MHIDEIISIAKRQRSRLLKRPGIVGVGAGPKISSGRQTSVHAVLIYVRRKHNVFLGKLENWLVTNDAGEFVPLPYHDPATPIPASFNKNNTNPNFPVPDSVRPVAIANLANYNAVNNILVGYHNTAHGRYGGQMPNPATSPSDPIFWPYHALLVGIYEHWRSH